MLREREYLVDENNKVWYINDSQEVCELYDRVNKNSLKTEYVLKSGVEIPF